jgi:DNA-binding MarR family transcriptional regulator
MKRELSAPNRTQKDASREHLSRSSTSEERTRIRTGGWAKVANGRKRAQKGFEVMATQTNPDTLVGILRDTVVALVRRDGPDLSARQLGVFLTVYLTDGPHTVRGLAAELNVSKPAITRALDRLGELDLARRKVDPMDRRSVLVQRTLKGAAFLRDMRSIMQAAEQTARESPPVVDLSGIEGANQQTGPARKVG